MIFHQAYPFQGVPLSGGALDGAIAAQEPRLFRPEMRRAFNGDAKSRIPPVYPPVKEVLVGMDHVVWVGLRHTDEGKRWLILSSAGEVMGKVTVPPNVTLRVADAAHAWGLERDELGIETVVRYRLPDRR